MPIIFDQPFQILLNLARDKKIDPWDVDINKLADLYIEKIREMEKLDLRVSGRALFSASALLRMKANASPDNNGHTEEEDELLEEVDFDMPELGPITIIRQSPRKITLSDLTSSLQEVLSDPQPNKNKRKKSEHVKKIMRNLDEYQINIEKHIREFHEKIALLTSDGEKINFTELLPEKNKLEIVRNLLLALFLSAKGKIALSQEEHFGDIFIRLIKSPEGDYDN